MSDPQLAARALSSALRMLGQREHTQREMRDKLRRKFAGLSTSELDEVLAELIGNGWLSDARFAEGLLNSRRNRGYGPIYIAREMQAKGLAEQISRELMAEDDTDWRAIAASQLGRRFPGAEHDLREWERAVRFLQRRGFPLNIVFSVVGERPTADELSQEF